MLQLREFSHNHHLSRVKILAENIRRGISDRHILLNHSFLFLFQYRKRDINGKISITLQKAL